MIVQPKQEFFQGTVASRNFDIDLSNDVNFGVAFDIISSGIYKDKPLAIVRELCSNAQDSHARAGTIRPFTVHVPTTIEPFWSVRDYGTGLAEHDVYRLLAGIFNSDKRRTNSEIGGFGLGSKTPFAYSDVYDITSWFNGTCYCFTAFRDGAGKPCVSLATSYASDEPNGILISVPVKTTDFRKFADATREGLRFFFPKPEIIGDTSVSFKLDTFFAGADNWRVIGGLNHVRVTMGPVAYPIDANLMRLDMNDEDEARIHRFLSSAKGFVVDIPMGRIRVTASREDVSYTPDTIAALKEEIKGVMASMRTWISGYLDSIQTPIEACMAYHRLTAVLGKDMLNAVDFSYSGIPLKPWFSLEKKDVDEAIQIRVPSMPRRTSRATLDAPDVEHVTIRPSMMGSNGRFEKPVIYYYNKVAGASARFNEHRKQISSDERGFIYQNGTLVLIGERERIEAFAKSIGTTLESGLFYDLSQVQMPVRLCSPALTIDDVRLLNLDYIVRRHIHKLERNHWEAQDSIESVIDDHGACYVVKTRGHHPVISGYIIDYAASSKLSAIRDAMAIGLIERRVIVGVKAAEYRKLEKGIEKGEIDNRVALLDTQLDALRARPGRVRKAIIEKIRNYMTSEYFKWLDQDVSAARELVRNPSYNIQIGFMMNSSSALLADLKASMTRACAEVGLKDFSPLMREMLPDAQRIRLSRVISSLEEETSSGRGVHSRKLSDLFASNPVLMAYLSPKNNREFFDSLL